MSKEWRELVSLCHRYRRTWPLVVKPTAVFCRVSKVHKYIHTCIQIHTNTSVDKMVGMVPYEYRTYLSLLFLVFYLVFVLLWFTFTFTFTYKIQNTQSLTYRLAGQFICSS